MQASLPALSRLISRENMEALVPSPLAMLLCVSLRVSPPHPHPHHFPDNWQSYRLIGSRSGVPLEDRTKMSDTQEGAGAIPNGAAAAVADVPPVDPPVAAPAAEDEAPPSAPTPADAGAVLADAVLADAAAPETTPEPTPAEAQAAVEGTDFDDAAEAEPEPEEHISFEDVFGDEFAAEAFARELTKTEDVRKVAQDLQRRIERVEDNLQYEQDLEEVFGGAEAARSLVFGGSAAPTDDATLARLHTKTADEELTTVRDLQDVHNVHVLSAPDGKRFNAHASRNRFFPASLTYLTTMPTIENYQCLHLPLTGPMENRRIKVGGDPEVLQDRKPIQAGLQGAGQTYPGAMFTPQNVIRWRKKRGVLHSNARMMKFDNGDTVMRVGTDYFVVERHDAAAENQHIMGEHGQALVEYERIRQRWRLRPLRDVRGVRNSTLVERQRKLREQSMPETKETAYATRFAHFINLVATRTHTHSIRHFVKGSKSNEQREAEYEQLYEEMKTTLDTRRKVPAKAKEPVWPCHASRTPHTHNTGRNPGGGLRGRGRPACGGGTVPRRRGRGYDLGHPRPGGSAGLVGAEKTTGGRLDCRAVWLFESLWMPSANKQKGKNKATQRSSSSSPRQFRERKKKKKRYLCTQCSPPTPPPLPNNIAHSLFIPLPRLQHTFSSNSRPIFTWCVQLHGSPPRSEKSSTRSALRMDVYVHAEDGGGGCLVEVSEDDTLASLKRHTAQALGGLWGADGTRCDLRSEGAGPLPIGCDEAAVSSLGLGQGDTLVASKPAYPLKPARSGDADGLRRGTASARLRCVCLSRCGGFVYGGGDDGCFSVWCAATAELLCARFAHAEKVTGVVELHVDGGGDAVSDACVLTASADGAVVLWTRSVGGTVFLPQRTFDAAATPAPTSVVRSLAAWGSGSGVAGMMPRLLYAAGGSSRIAGWDFATGEPVETLAGEHPCHHSDTVLCLAAAEEAGVLLSGGWDGVLRAWNVSDGGALAFRYSVQTCGHFGAFVSAVAVAPNGREVVFGGEGSQAVVVDVASGVKLRSLEGHCGMIWAIGVTACGTYAVTGCDDEQMRVWHLESGALVDSVDTGASHVRGISLSLGGVALLSSVAACGGHLSVALWE